MALYARDVSPSERTRLERWRASQDRDLRHRARVVLLSAEGRRIPEIARLLSAHPANLRKWIRRFNERGCQGLVTVRSGGAKPRITEAHKARIVALARLDPRDLGLDGERWTLHKLARAASELGIVDRISHEYVRQILRNANGS